MVIENGNKNESETHLRSFDISFLEFNFTDLNYFLRNIQNKSQLTHPVDQVGYFCSKHKTFHVEKT